MSAESEVKEVITRIETAWRNKEFHGLENCFHEDAVIIGPNQVEFARGRTKCAESYREFATNADVLAYAESAHALWTWNTTAIYTYAWEMTYQRKGGPNRESGTDELVFQLGADGWQLVWRYLFFQPMDL